MKTIFILLASFLATNAFGGTSEYYIESGTFLPCSLRTIIETPVKGTKIKADMLFFIGFGDRADNHAPLFKLLASEGIRVISFDYPSHGKTVCGTLNHDNFTTLSQYAETIEKRTRQDSGRPLYISGWSTGGLLALRMLQNQYLTDRFVQGLVLIAPGVSVYKLVGGDGIVRESTLLQNPNPPHMGPPLPISPLLTPLFSSALVLNGQVARSEGMPKFLPTLVLVAGDKLDMYSKTNELKKWIKKEKFIGSNILGIQCPRSMHEMDNELEPIGGTVRQAIKDFVVSPNKTIKLKNQSACTTL